MGSPPENSPMVDNLPVKIRPDEGDPIMGRLFMGRRYFNKERYFNVTPATTQCMLHVCGISLYVMSQQVFAARVFLRRIRKHRRNAH